MDETFRLYGSNDYKFNLLEEKEQEELFDKYINGDKSLFNKLFNSNLRIVYYVVDKYYNKLDFNDKEDLFQVGCIGLINAIRGYNNKLGYNFFQYAYKIILYTMRTYKRKNLYLFSVPKEIHDIIYKIESNNLVYCSSSEISTKLGIDEDKIKEVFDLKIDSLDKVINDDEILLYDIIPSNINIEEEYDELEEQEELYDAIALLSDRDELIIKMYYGIDCDECSQSEISKKLNISQSYVSRVLKKSYNFLKDIMSDNTIKVKTYKKN